MLGAYCDLLLLGGVLLFWMLAKAFSQKLQDYDNLRKSLEEGSNNLIFRKRKWWTVKSELRALGEIGDVINRQFGTIVTLFLLGYILSYAIIFNDVFDHRKDTFWNGFFNSVFYFGQSCGILIIAADVSRQVRAFYKS